MALPDSSRSDSGFALIEVIVSAVVLATVALAVLSGIDAANGASTREKARAVAATLAEQDQERMRSMDIDMAAAPSQQGIVKVGGVAYTVKSTAQWVTDNIGGAPACGDKSDQVQYLHITSTVTSAVVGTRIPPVTIDSLVAPTVAKAESQGTLAVKIVDRTGAKGVPAISVGARSSTFTAAAEVTDKDGCAVFRALPTGTYTLTLDTPGYLDRTGTQLSTATATVVAKKVTSTSMTYDRATKAQISVVTNLPGTTFPTASPVASYTDAVSVRNGASVGWMKTFQPGTDLKIEATNLFPFAENSYTFFTGGCAYASPDTYKPANTNYFTTGNSAAALLSDPANLTQPVTVRQPPLNIRVLRGQTSSTAAFADGDIKVFVKPVKPTGSTDPCARQTYELTTKPWPTATGTPSPPRAITGTNNNHWLSRIGSTYDPGMPFGNYEICLLHTVNGTTKRAMYAAGSLYDNTSATGATPQLDLNLSWTTASTCAFS